MVFSKKAMQTIEVPVPTLRVPVEMAQALLDQCMGKYAQEFIFDVETDIDNPKEKTVTFMVQYKLKRDVSHET